MAEVDMTIAPNKYRLTHKTSREQIERWIKTNINRECVYAIHTPWWSLYEERWMPYRSGNLPCDPRGSMLLQGNLSVFWDAALENPDHYGKHGIDALVAAFHGNVEVMTSDGRGWRPTSLAKWDHYNRLLDQQKKGIRHG